MDAQREISYDPGEPGNASKGQLYTEGYREEIPDPTPVAMPLGYHHPEPLEHMIARLVRYESVKAEMAGEESFAEADDFDTDEEPEFVSQFEMKDMVEDRPHGHKPDKDAPKLNAKPSEKAKEKQAVKPDKKAPKKVAAEVETDESSEEAE